MEFAEVFHPWLVDERRDEQGLDPLSDVTVEQVQEMAKRHAPDIVEEGLRMLFESAAESSIPDGERIVRQCRSLAVDIAAPALPTALTEKPQSSPAAQPSSGYSEGLQLQALREIWATTSPQEQRATCVIYSKYPDDHIDGFMSQVGDAMSESLVRRFYDDVCL